MINTRTTVRIAIVVGAASLAAVGLPAQQLAGPQGQGLGGIVGTWYFRVPDGTSGFYTFGNDGTLSGVATTIFGGPPRPGTFNATDFGVWRRVRGGFEAVAFRMGYDMDTGDVQTITRIRTIFDLDPGHKSYSGVFFVAQWVCPTPFSCPDPNVDPPDVPEFTPPGNTFSATRVLLP